MTKSNNLNENKVSESDIEKRLEDYILDKNEPKIDYANIDYANIDYTNPDEIEKHYRPILLLVARIIYMKFIKGPVAPYIQAFILLILFLPSELFIKSNSNFIMFLYFKLIKSIDLNDIKNNNEKHIIKLINRFCLKQISKINKKIKQIRGKSVSIKSESKAKSKY
jgi:hypothetical protein